MTDSEFFAWLASPQAYRTVLLEAGANSGGLEVTRRLATMPYVTGPDDDPANTPYMPVLAGGLDYRESLGLEGNSGESAAGDIELQNADGALDGWLDDVWSNRPLAAYIGDVRWARADFRLIFSGICDGIDSRSRERLNLRLRDKSLRLNRAVTETVVGGTGTAADTIVPLTFGEVHNITPILANPVTLEYAVHDGPIERVIEVRDNGKPVEFTPYLSTGRFRLAARPVGTITASVQGDKPGGVYAHDVSSIVRRLVSGYGRAQDRFTDDDVDVDQFAAFALAEPQGVGLFLAGRTTVFDAAQRVADSIGARLVFSRDGRLRLLRVEVPPAGTPIEVTPDDMVDGSLRVGARTTVGAACRLGYARNWTIQEALRTSIPPEHKAMYAQEWFETSAGDAAVASLYGIDEEPELEETLLLTREDADAERDRRLALRVVQRTLYEFTAFAPLIGLELGQPIRLQHPRFGLQDGRVGQVVALSVDWLRARVNVGVLV